ncbi:hypothetical protein AGMMS50229_20100 [Campylobacterota bacterium]|nr:hypothetical protein AGMMS50229_20100 [Campylobacterota bacterium]
MSATDDMTYSDAIEAVMANNNYFAPLKLLYKEIWKYKNRSKIVGKTVNNTIQERVQRDKRFIKIGLGVYALADKIHLLEKSAVPTNDKDRAKTRHIEMQGMLLETGNSKNDVEETYTNDKKCAFNNKSLGSLATLKTVPPFTYEKIVKESVSFMDVVWFNQRGFPSKAFEVESSTNFRDAFVKFMELQDFITEFCCVSPLERKTKFDRELDKTAFLPIRNRVRFLSYEAIESDYKHSLERTHI